MSVVMATQDYSPHLKRVLRTYQNTAMTSLSGPGGAQPTSYRSSQTRDSAASLIHKLIDYDELKPGGASSAVEYECGANGEKVTVKQEKGIDLGISERDKCKQSVSATDSKVSCQLSICEQLAVGGSHAGPGKLSSLAYCSEKQTCEEQLQAVPQLSQVEPEAFIVPPPFPPQPGPILSRADAGSPGSAGVGETMLEGEIISCFTIGGEKRLCLAQLFNTVLREFRLADINNACDDLQIYCSRCTPLQLESLKASNILPSNAISCGLITKTDAQRLSTALLHWPNRTAPQLRSHLKRFHFLVYHNCFGKAKGSVIPELYIDSVSPCIECIECKFLFNPNDFVCHAHTNLEKRISHWGFDSLNWRSYLLLDKDQPLQQQITLGQIETAFDKFKAKFDVNINKHKRKQEYGDGKEEQAKKVRCDDVGSSSSSSSYVVEGVPGPSREHVMFMCPWQKYTVIGGAQPATFINPWATAGGKTLPPPPLGFIRDSMPAPVPSYLSQGPPVLVDPKLVVPISETEKFERHYQPNVALAPPKVRDKLARDPTKHIGASFTIHPRTSLKLIDLSKSQRMSSNPRRSESGERAAEGGDGSGSIADLCTFDLSSGSGRLRAGSPLDARSRARPAQPLPLLPAEVDLTTDSDSDSTTSRGEVVEEVEALLRGWSDRSAASKVAQIVALQARKVKKDQAAAYAAARRAEQYKREAEEYLQEREAVERQLRAEIQQLQHNPQSMETSSSIGGQESSAGGRRTTSEPPHGGNRGDSSLSSIGSDD